MSKIKVAIVGLGNCANSLIQGVEYYKNADINAEVPSSMAHHQKHDLLSEHMPICDHLAMKHNHLVQCEHVRKRSFGIKEDFQNSSGNFSS